MHRFHYNRQRRLWRTWAAMRRTPGRQHRERRRTTSAGVSHLVLVLCLFSQAQPASVLRLYPVDDTARDPSFRKYVGRLRSAVDARNTEALRKLVAPDVVVGRADDDQGWTKFVARWRPDDPQNSPAWGALSDLLSLGFIQEHPALFLSPYLVWRFPHDLSTATHLVVVRDKVSLRRAPSVSAPVVGLLSFDIVRQLGEPAPGEGLGEWVRVRALDGETGYLNTRDVMTPGMPRAQFGLRRGRWVMIALEGPDP